jgi:hypothetical protein
MDSPMPNNGVGSSKNFNHANNGQFIQMSFPRYWPYRLLLKLAAKC